MAMTEERAQELFENVIDLFGEVPEEVAEEIQQKADHVYEDEDNSFYARLGCLVGWGCLWENGGSQNTRSWLGAVGASEEEKEQLIAEFGDCYY
ncbi:hypothetical protein [Ruminococcus sp.]|uniref:hypothetical protein n=1 Tax=Ruminococcus sp. TaxID=41978 RepID=UPI00388DA39A